jgi:hypothetical protein
MIDDPAIYPAIDDLGIAPFDCAIERMTHWLNAQIDQSESSISQSPIAG